MKKEKKHFFPVTVGAIPELCGGYHYLLFKVDPKSPEQLSCYNSGQCIRVSSIDDHIHNILKFVHHLLRFLCHVKCSHASENSACWYRYPKLSSSNRLIAYIFRIRPVFFTSPSKFLIGALHKKYGFCKAYYCISRTTY